MVFQLSKELWFPPVDLAEENGMLAIGGDLSVDRLLLAYQNGIFPWYAFRHHEITWFCPRERFVIFPSEIHVSHSMRTLMNKGRYRLSINEAFKQVIGNCGKLRLDEEYAWLGPDMTKAYTELYRQRFAASVEVWEPLPPSEQTPRRKEKLVGGLYGVVIGRAFFGESMFSLVPSGSKLALIHLARVMQEVGGVLIDCQFETPHLRSMGGRFISYEQYMQLISS